MLPTDDEQERRRWLVQFAKDHPRWGGSVPISTVGARDTGVKNKRVQRLWRLEGLKVPYRKRKKPLGSLGGPIAQ